MQEQYYIPCPVMLMISIKSKNTEEVIFLIKSHISVNMFSLSTEQQKKT